MADFSPRAQKTLISADLILAEDTRVTRKLMGLFGIQGKVERCDEATTAQGIARACDVLTAGGVVAFCADAGTPGISDPGERLAQGVMDRGFATFAIPGPCAALTALTISGLASGQFMFAGFAPAKAGPRSGFLSDLAQIKTTLIFYETGPRLLASLTAMHEAFGNRPACVARELTKMYEEVRRGLLVDLIEHYGKSGAPKGEIVIVIEGAADIKAHIEDDDLDAMIATALKTKRLKDAAAEIAARTGLARRDIYARGVALGKGKPT
ncbi:MAG: 16S rRNA (cytidine(1402)-2'-O)-methyltransferase [Hyphomonadaceae bacterium]|nr:16S rRNA (cytidine(1402)-2'-O)-methyltransferase [Hyphomonadaceae bacterium]